MNSPSLKDLRRQRARQRTGWRWWLWLPLGGVALTALYAALGFWVAPLVLRRQIEQRLSTEFGRPVTAGLVRANPFNFSLTVNDFVMGDRQGGGPFITWQKVFVNLDLASCFSDEILCQEISIEGLKAHVAVSKEGRLNCEDLFQRSAARSTTTRPVRIDRFSVAEAQVHYSDATGNATVQSSIGPVSFFLRNFRTSGQSDAPGVFSAAAEGGETLTWRGAFAISPLRSHGEIALGRIGLRKYARYFAPLVPCDLRGGVLDAKVTYNFWIENGRPSFRLTDGHVAIEGLQAADPGAPEPSWVCDRLRIQGLNANMATRILELPVAELQGGRMDVLREASGAWRFGSVWSSRSGPTSAGPEWEVKLGELGVKGLALNLLDRTAGGPPAVVLRAVTGSLRHFSNRSQPTTGVLEFAAEAASGARLEAAGSIRGGPLQAELNWSLSNAPVADLNPYLTSALKGGRFDSGIAEGAGQLIWADGVVLRGQMRVADLRWLDAAAQEVLQTRHLEVSGMEIEVAAARLSATEIALEAPRATFVFGGPVAARPASRNAARRPAPLPSAPQHYLAVDKLVVSRGSLTLLDRTVDPASPLVLQAVEATLTGASSSELARADLDLRARFEERGTLAAKGQLNAFAPGTFADLRIDVRNASVAPLRPYVEKFGGSRLQAGVLSVDGRWRASQRKINSQFNLTIDQLEAEDAVAGSAAGQLSLSLALMLLRDAQGKVVVPLPIQGNLDDPDFRLGSVLARAFETSVSKVARSPFAFVASKAGLGYKGEELSFQEFEAGETALDYLAERKLGAVARQMREAPELHLQLEGNFDPAVDPVILQERELDRRVRANLWRDLSRMNPSLPPEHELEVKKEDLERIVTVMYKRMKAEEVPKVEKAKEERQPSRWSLTRLFRRNPTPPPKDPAPAAPGVGGFEPAQPLPPFEQLRQEVLDSIAIDDRALRQLAVGRAEAVREYLVTHGQIARERIGLAPHAGQGARVNLRFK